MDSEITPNLSYPVLNNYSESFIIHHKHIIHNIICNKYFNGNPNFTEIINVLPGII